MEPSKEDKNAAIAEMLGAEKEQWYPENKDNKTTGIYYKFPKDIAIGLGLTTLPASGDYGLKFHSNANWQFEALDFIERSHLCSIIIQSDFIGVNALKTSKLSYWVEVEKNFKDEMGKTVNDLVPESFITDYFPSRKEAIFEALYQFSEYLKSK